MCGPPLFIICSPVFAVAYGVTGAVGGGQLGAQAGVKMTRIASAPESPKSASEPSAPESSGQSMMIEPAQAPGYDKKTPSDSEKTVDLPVSAPQLSSPVTNKKLEVRTALVGPTRTSVRTDTAADAQTRLPTGIEVKTRSLTGEDVVNHFNRLRTVEVKAPPDLMSLLFRGGNRFEILYWTARDASGFRQEGTYSVRPDQNVVCLSLPAEQRAGGFGVGSEWMSDCFHVSRTDEKTYSLKTLKGDYSFSYAVR
jgi:hypothetical protein